MRNRVQGAATLVFPLRPVCWLVVGWLALVGWSGALPALALDGGTLRVNPRNGWQALELITSGDNPSGDGSSWAMPGTFDGLGAWLPSPTTLRVLVNHEQSDATVSEVEIDLSSLQLALGNVLQSGSSGGGSFVTAARQAYSRWSDDAGATWTATSGVSNTAFSRFCSGQMYVPGAFGPGRGFVDPLYLTGEESAGGRLFALDAAQRDWYQVSGVAGAAPGGLAGMPADNWENAALLDTGETEHVALLLSPDGGSQALQLYVGEKGKDAAGNASGSFLARNGLAYGSHYYLHGALPGSGTAVGGSFDTSLAGALISSKLEDVDTNPNTPNQAVLGDQNSGLFVLDFSLDFSGGPFAAGGSTFAVTKIQDHVNDVDDQFGDADNVDWTRATVLGENDYPEGLIFVNEDTATGNGEIWVNRPDGSALTKIGDTTGIAGATESTGILDISQLVGYRPGSIVLTANQGTNASLTALVHPDATLQLPGDFNFDGAVNGQDFLHWQRGQSPLPVSATDLATWQAAYGTVSPLVGQLVGQLAGSAVPEPSAGLGAGGLLLAALATRSRRSGRDSNTRERRKKRGRIQELILVVLD